MSKLLFLMIDGLGISAAWKGNAVLSANPANFFDLWQNNPHFLLENSVLFDEFYSQKLIHSQIATGQNQLSNKRFIDQLIAGKSSEYIKSLKSIFNQAVERKCAVHFIGCLPKAKNGKYSDKNQLISFVKEANDQGVLSIRIHLFVDETFSGNEAQTAVNDLEQDLDKVEIASIATISGLSCADFGNAKNLIKSLVVGGGKKVLSASQAIGRYGTVSPTSMPACVIHEKNEPIGRINDFDTIFFFNSEIGELETTLKNYLSLDYIKWFVSALKLPRFVSFAVPLKNSLLGDEVKFLAERTFSPTLSSLISNAGLSQVEIADAERLDYYQNYFNDKVETKGLEKLFLPFEDPYKTLDDTFRATISVLHDDKFDVVYSETSILDHFFKNNNFREAIKSIVRIDHYLKEIKETAAKKNYTVLLCSNHGGVEKMADLSKIEKINLKSSNPAFAILFDSGKTQSKRLAKNIHDQFMYDMIEKKNNLVDLAPTVLDILGLPIPKVMEGKSLV